MTTQEILEAASRNELVTPLISDEWRTQVFACAAGRHDPVRFVSFPGGWKIFTCCCGQTVHQHPAQKAKA